MTKKSIINGITQPGLIREITLGDLFENTCRNYPRKTGILFNDVSISYQLLDEKSTTVANYLFSKGIGPGCVLGVWLDRGPDLHICILGIIKSGAAYVPFDEEMPADRVSAVLDEIKAAGCFISRTRVISNARKINQGRKTIPEQEITADREITLKRETITELRMDRKIIAGQETSLQEKRIRQQEITAEQGPLKQQQISQQWKITRYPQKEIGGQQATIQQLGIRRNGIDDNQPNANFTASVSSSIIEKKNYISEKEDVIKKAGMEEKNDVEEKESVVEKNVDEEKDNVERKNDVGEKKGMEEKGMEEKKKNAEEKEPFELLPGFTTFYPDITYEEGALIPGKKHQTASPDDTAYIIYTSGSTGRPKGIPINHRQICHFLLAENSILGIRSSDIVYQGFSVSFDMWLEETWISYLVGATLVISDAVTAKSFDSLHLFLKDHQVTVLHAVPSLLALLDKNIPNLRLINSGGEACTPNVQKKWCSPKLELYNSYGPTETTVSASIARLDRDSPITIGNPLPNYGMALVDSEINPVEPGEKGELVISGPGLSKGYINRAELTTGKFLSKPASLAALAGDRIYLTGDAGFMDRAGKIHLTGRMDDQVKLRGYRIELGEIEEILNRLDDITQSAVVLKKWNGVESLIAYVINGSDTETDEIRLKKEISRVLPAYMVPSRIITLKEFPRLPSGKVNKKLLPDFVTPDPLPESGLTDPSGYGSTIEQKAMFILKRLFPDETVLPGKDFFDDLGGHSLLAALFVSELRENAGVEGISIKDVYIHRPVSALLTYWESPQYGDPVIIRQEQPTSKKVKSLDYYTCWFAQSIALVVIYGLLAAQIFVPYLGYYYLQQDLDTHLVPILIALLLFCMMPILQTVLSISLKWIIIGRTKEGDYPLWGGYYFRWWLTRRLLELVQVQVISGTPLFNQFLNLLGAKVASDAQLSNFLTGAEDLLQIGANVTISSNVVLNNAWVENGYLKLRKIEILDNGYIGTSSVVNGNCRIEKGGELSDLSVLGSGEIIRENYLWTGSPAKPVTKKVVDETASQPEVNDFIIRKYKLVYGLLFLVFPFAVLLPLLPTILVLNYLDDNAEDYDFGYLVITPALAIMYLIIFLVLVVLLSRWLQHKVKPGHYPVYSFFYVKKWLADQLLALSLTVLHPIYASVYISYFFRLLGAKVGKNTEISTASNVTHKLFEIGNESFIADAVTLGESDIRNHEIILDTTRIGNKSFVGNSSLIPQGYQLGNDMLIAVLSVPPLPEQQQNTHTRDWLGSPAIALPKRQGSISFPPALTFHPSFSRKLARGTIEFIRIIIPETVILCLSILFIAYGHDLLTEYSIPEIILLFPVYYLGIVAVPAFLLTVLLKWLVIGKYKEEQLPMWSLKVWLSEGITSLYESLSIPFFLDYLRGTPWLPLLLKLYGVKTGYKVWMDTTDITEFDMVTIGSDTAVNRESGPQTHLFEDRIMKIGPVVIGKGCVIGARSIILYNTHIGDNTIVAPLSLVMKGETLPANTRWAGSPVSRLSQ